MQVQNKKRPQTRRGSKQHAVLLAYYNLMAICQLYPIRRQCPSMLPWNSVSCQWYAWPFEVLVDARLIVYHLLWRSGIKFRVSSCRQHWSNICSVGPNVKPKMNPHGLKVHIPVSKQLRSCSNFQWSLWGSPRACAKILAMLFSPYRPEIWDFEGSLIVNLSVAHPTPSLPNITKNLAQTLKEPHNLEIWAGSETTLRTRWDPRG